MAINSDLFNQFYKLTKKDLSQYFQRVLNFMQTDYNTIQKFYQGTIKTISSSSFKNFATIQGETTEVFQLIRKSDKQMNNIVWWDLLDQIEEIDNRLQTLKNINRWARSSQDKVGWSPNNQLEVVLNQNGTLERVSQDILNSSNSQDDWVQIALDNDLYEDQYTADGGAKITVTVDNKSGSNFQIFSVVDVIKGITIYGKDIDSILHFEDNDLSILSYEDTILQAIDILVKLRKNDNPDFPSIGLQSNLLIGSSQASLNFPVIIRQLNDTFQTDDSLKNFTVTAIRFEQDNLYVDFTVMSRLGEVMSQSSIL